MCFFQHIEENVNKCILGYVCYPKAQGKIYTYKYSDIRKL